MFSVGPLFFAAQLVANLIIFWIVLGLENFTKEMQIGTYVIVVAVTLLLRVGPNTQDDQDFVDLILRPHSLIWSGVLLSGMMFTSYFVLIADMMKYTQWTRINILLLSRATAFALNLTAGRAMILKADRTWIIITTVIKIVSGGIYTKAIVVQSTAVDQNTFVPLNAAAIIVTNAITGVIIWEDWRVVRDWTGYACVFLLLIMGCNLLLGDLKLLNEMNPTMLQPRYSWVRSEGRRQLFDDLQHNGESSMYGAGDVHACSDDEYGGNDDENDAALQVPSSISSSGGFLEMTKPNSPGEAELGYPQPPEVGPAGEKNHDDRSTTTSRTNPARRQSAWKSLYGIEDFDPTTLDLHDRHPSGPPSARSSIRSSMRSSMRSSLTRPMRRRQSRHSIRNPGLQPPTFRPDMGIESSDLRLDEEPDEPTEPHDNSGESGRE